MYKIKLRQSGYRLVYQVEDNVITVTVLAIGKRERSDVYNKATAYDATPFIRVLAVR